MTLIKIKQIADSLRNGSQSVSQLCEACLRRMKRTTELNAFISQVPEAARQAAVESQNRIINGSKSVWEGIPIAVKDNFSTTGIQTSCGSRMLHGYIPPYNATVVQRLLDRGALLVGKTNLDEFAMGCGSVDGTFGPVRNPWNYKFKVVQDSHRELHSSLNAGNGVNAQVEVLGRRHSSHKATTPFDDIIAESEDWYIAGGSSGGSAVAVAAGVAFAALGSDTGGSTRNPASYCGIVGLKPTYGLLSRHGLISLVNSMDVPGLMTRCVDDVALLLNALAGHDPLDSTTVTDRYQPIDLENVDCYASLRGLTVGIPRDYHVLGTAKDTLEAWQKVADLLSDAGANVKEVSMPHTKLALACYYILCTSEVASNMARYDSLQYGFRSNDESSTEALYAASRRTGLNDVVRGRILTGNYFLLKKNYEKYYVRAQQVRRLISEDFRRVFSSGVDVLLTPTVLGDAPRYDWFSNANNQTRTLEQDAFTEPPSIAGVPAINIPVRLSSNGLPIGLQLVGRPFAEQQLLVVAKSVEQFVNFRPLDLSFLDS